MKSQIEETNLDLGVNDFILSYLTRKGFTKSSLTFEKEISNGPQIFGTDIMFIRKLVHEGMWDEIFHAISPLKTDPIAHRSANFIVKRQILFEKMFCENQDQLNEAEISALLLDIEKFCDEGEFDSICDVLKEPLSDSFLEHWSAESGRIDCFNSLLGYLKFIFEDQVVPRHSISEDAFKSCLQYIGKRTNNGQINLAQFLGADRASDISERSILLSPLSKALSGPSTFAREKSHEREGFSRSNSAVKSSLINDFPVENFEQKSNFYKPELIASKNQPIRTAKFNKSGNYLAYGCNDTSLTVCRVSGHSFKTYKEYPNIHNGSIYSLSWNASLDLLATGSNDKKVQLCNLLGDKSEIYSLSNGHNGTVRTVNFSSERSNSNFLLTGGAGDFICRLWDISSNERPIALLEGHTSTVYDAKLFPHDSKAISGGAESSIHLWDIRSKKSFGKITTFNESEVLALEICPDEDYYILASHPNGSLCQYDLRKLRFVNEILCIEQAECRVLSYSKNGQLLSGYFDGSLYLVETKMHSIYNSVKMKNCHKGGILSADWHPSNGMFLSSGLDGCLYTWDKSLI